MWKRSNWGVFQNHNNLRKPITKEDRKPGEYPYYGANGIQDYVDDYTVDGTYLLIGEDGSVITKHDTPVINWLEGKAWINNHAHILTLKDSSGSLRYYYHRLKRVNIYPFITGANPLKLTRKNLDNIAIYVHSPKVQIAIANHLDDLKASTDELAANLEREAEIREKLYKGAQRRILLNAINHPDVQRKAMKTFARRNRGISITAEKMRELEKLPGDDIRIFAGGQTFADVSSDHVDKKYTYTEPSIIAKTRGIISFERYSDPFTHKSEIWSYTVQDDNVDQDFIYFYLDFLRDDLTEYALTKSVRITQLSTKDLDNLIVPLPPLEVQREATSILNELESSSHFLVSQARQAAENYRKGYSYALDRLFDFSRFN